MERVSYSYQAKKLGLARPSGLKRENRDGEDELKKPSGV